MPRTPAIVLLLVASAALASACAPVGGGDPFADRTRAPLEIPGSPELSNPVSAVHAYTEWISFAYVSLDAALAGHAFSAGEEVRVDSYVQRNLSEHGRGIHQVLTQSAYDLVSQEETSAVVTGEETWIYRYFDARTREYTSDVLEASYDVTYTVIAEEGKGWVVDRVEATPRSEVE